MPQGCLGTCAMSSIATTGGKIKGRSTASDRFYTPQCVVEEAVRMVPPGSGVWMDPFKGLGAYYNSFPVPVSDRRWCELDLGKDFFEYTDQDVDVICSNPPYSLLNRVFEHTVVIRPKVVNYAIGAMNLTKNRMNIMTNAGYALTKMHIVDIKGWFGQTFICQWELGAVDPAITSTAHTIKNVDGSGYGPAR